MNDKPLHAFECDCQQCLAEWDALDNPQKKINGWIKCSDRLPDNDDGVIIYSFKDGIGIGSYCIGLVEENRSGWDTAYDWAIREIPTHWMPFPDKPRDE